MFKALVAYALGIASVMYCAFLFSLSWIGVFFVLMCMMFFLSIRVSAMALLGWYLLGVVMTSFLAQQYITAENSISMQPTVMTGVIASIPKNTRCYAAFDFKTQKHTIRLSWYQCQRPKLRVGDAWTFRVKLKPIHGLANPGGFDFDTWALSHHVIATGYIKTVIKGPVPQWGWGLQRLRQSLYERICHAITYPVTANLMAALTLGIKQSIPWDTMHLFQTTGTSHLIAISGLHIGLVTGAVYAVSLWVLTILWPTNRRIVPRDVAALVALFVALAYALLAGFSVPTQRAFFMVFMVTMAVLCRRNISLWHAWVVAMLGCLLLNPFEMLSPSLWLSFFAVAILFYGFQGRVTSGNIVLTWGRLQGLLFFGLLPMTALFFGQFALISPLANMLAVPWVSMCVLPLSLLGNMFALSHLSYMATLCFILASDALLVLMHVLAYLAHFSFSSVMLHVSLWGLLFALLGVVICFAPKGVPCRWLGSFCFLPLLFPVTTVLPKGQFTLTMLDVGQGLSLVVHTRLHTLVYDTGAKYMDGNDMGRNVLVPYLSAKGIHHVNVLMVSHGDNDHSGGVASLLHAVKVDRVLTSVPRRFSQYMDPAIKSRDDSALSGKEERMNSLFTLCQQGQHWEWDGVQFEVLYPDRSHLHQGNNSSCVLKISTGDASALLVGDIEHSAEKWLATHEYKALNSSVLVVPHHGSRTSSSKLFLKAVQPKFALFSYGYLNRFHFPNQDVLSRYQSMSAKSFNTSEAGAVTLIFQPDHPVQLLHANRNEKRPKWLF